MTEADPLANDLRSAIAANDARALAEAATAIDRRAFDEARFPGSLFLEVIAALKSPALRASTDSVALVKLFEFGLDLLSASQREQLAEALHELIPKTADETAAFVAVELLVELWSADRLLKALQELRTAPSEQTLLIVVHGYDWLAKRNQEPPVKSECLARLGELSRSPQPTVAAEARSALRKRGGTVPRPA